MSLPEIRDAVREWVRTGQAWGEAVLIGVRRSAPRPPGARYAAAADGSFAGSISAGCVEADLREHILSMLDAPAGAATKLVSYGISDEMAATVGLSCGGEIDVLIRRHEPEDPVWADLGALLAGGAEERRQGALVTGLSEDTLGRQILVLPDGSTTGSLGELALNREVVHSLGGLLRREGSERQELPSGKAIFVDRILPARRLVVVGATPVAASLAELAARVGYRVAVVDPREGLALPSLFPDADLRIEWPDEALAALGVDEWTDVAVLAHDERLDVPALRAAIDAGCRYVGLLGGKRTQRARKEELRTQGVPAPAVDRIRGPIGLDIGAVTPQEIAVSILAEMLAVRRLGPAGS